MKQHHALEKDEFIFHGLNIYRNKWVKTPS